MAADPRIIRTLEEISFNAWAALQTVYYDGWLVRFANGYTRRVNSVNPIYPSALAADAKITRCEQLYNQRGQRTVFKMTPAVFPDTLDDLLAQRGYTKEALTTVQLAPLNNLPVPERPADLLTNAPTKDWLDAFCRLNTIDPRHRPTMEHMLASVVPHCAFIALHHENEIAAVGLAVVDGAYVGLYDIVTDARWRGRGLGTQLVLNLLHWGKAQGAQTAYLQVMANNNPALRLYHQIGFRDLYPYWYRVKGLP